MKKILVAAAVAIMTVFSASAQSSDMFFANAVQNVRLGYAGAANSSATNLKGGVDFGVNVIEFGIRPYSSAAISLGADFMLDTFHPSKGHYFLSAAGRTAVMPAITIKPKYSTATVLAFGVPLNFTQTIGDKMNVTIGATAKVNLNASTRLVYADSDNKHHTERASGIHTNRFTYDIHAAIDVNGFGIYASYSPQQTFESGYGPAFNLFSVGLIFKH